MAFSICPGPKANSMDIMSMVACGLIAAPTITKRGIRQRVHFRNNTEGNF